MEEKSTPAISISLSRRPFNKIITLFVDDSPNPLISREVLDESTLL